MKTIYTINTTDGAHLEAVMEEMKVLGSPKIRAFWTGDAYLAIEGSHRVAAAAALGLPVTVAEVDEGDEISDHDLSDLDSVCTVAAILEYGDWTAEAHQVDVA